MLAIGHHDDDGIDGEYWFIYDDSKQGWANSFVEAFDTEEEAEIALSKMTE